MVRYTFGVVIHSHLADGVEVQASRPALTRFRFASSYFLRVYSSGRISRPFDMSLTP